MPVSADDEGGEETGSAGAGQAGNIIRVPSSSRFKPTLLWRFKPNTDVQIDLYFSNSIRAERCANRAGHGLLPQLEAYDMALEFDGVGIVPLFQLGNGFTIWLRLDTGTHLVFRGNLFQYPEHRTLAEARGAVRELLNQEKASNSEPISSADNPFSKRP